jgi:DNA-binding NarL/FixJ family response regulator
MPADTSGVTRLRAFLVEDSPIVVETLSAALEEIAEVDIVGCAGTQEEALSWFGARTDECDVAIIDIFLQSGSGLGVLEAMRDFAPPPQRVVLTNYSTRDMRARCKALGAEEVFDKSTEVDELMSWLHHRRAFLRQ